MKNPSEDSPVDGVDTPDWLDAVVVTRLTAAEIESRCSELANRPKELNRFKSELALNAVLDARPKVPRLTLNFSAQVWAKIGASTHPKKATATWWSGLLKWPVWQPAFGLGMATVVIAIGWQAVNRHQRVEMAGSVALGAFTTSSSTLEDFDVIRRLGTTVRPSDADLIAALAEPAIR